jgi:hypothetical protein
MSGGSAQLALSSARSRTRWVLLASLWLFCLVALNFVTQPGDKKDQRFAVTRSLI